jgi:hypothetical protein
MNTAAIRHNVGEPIRAEYVAAFRVLRETLACIPDEEWLSGDSKLREPVRQVCHLLLALEGYLGGHKARSGQRFGTPVDSFVARVDTDSCPSPSDILPWIEELEEVVERHLEKALDLTLSDKAKKHPPLNRALYVLRHTTVHTAYLIWELRGRGIPCRGY